MYNFLFASVQRIRKVRLSILATSCTIWSMYDCWMCDIHKLIRVAGCKNISINSYLSNITCNTKVIVLGANKALRKVIKLVLKHHEVQRSCNVLGPSLIWIALTWILTGW